MRKRCRLIFAALVTAAVLIGAPLHAAPTTTTVEMVRRCELGENPARDAVRDYVWCLGYFAGILDTYYILAAAERAGDAIMPYTFCLPDGVTPKQGTAIFKKWVKDNSDKMHLYPQNAIYFAFTVAFPCK